MRKTFGLLALILIFSCSKDIEQESRIPDGYEIIEFSAGLEQTKTAISGLSVHWTGEEKVHLWYKNTSGTVRSVEASFISFSGTQAEFSALLPSDAVKDDFYADVNGVNDSGSAFYPWGDRGPRTIVPVEQTATPGSYDPSAMAIGARWVKSGDSDKPVFAFKNLHNLLKITIDNRVGNIIDTITISSSSNICCKNYWSIDESGKLKISYSGSTSTAIKLCGTLATGKADYYIVVPVKNNNGSKFKLDNMSLSCHFTEPCIYSVHNSHALELDVNSLSAIGSFILSEKTVNYPDRTPFGTNWGADYMKAWNAAGFAANTAYVGTASEDTRTVPTAKGTACCSKEIKYNNSGNERMVGKFSFEFTAAHSGDGILSFYSQAGSTNHTASVLKNGTLIQKVTYTSTTTALLTQVKMTVKAGDVIKICYNNSSSYAFLYCGGDYTDSEGNLQDRRIRWDDDPNASGTIQSPEDLNSDNSSSSFFGEM